MLVSVVARASFAFSASWRHRRVSWRVPRNAVSCAVLHWPHLCLTAAFLNASDNPGHVGSSPQPLCFQLRHSGTCVGHGVRSTGSRCWFRASEWVRPREANSNGSSQFRAGVGAVAGFRVGAEGNVACRVRRESLGRRPRKTNERVALGSAAPFARPHCLQGKLRS